MSEQPQKYHPLHNDLQPISDQQAPPEGASSVWTTLGALANRIKAITGRSTFRDSPPTNLTEAKAHHDHRQNPHVVTRAQLGAAAQTALDSHTADQQNPHGVTAAQAGARPASYVPSWGEITSKPSTYPSTWDTVAGKPATYPPSTHTHDYAPASHVGSGGTAHANATASTSGFFTPSEKNKLSDLAIPPRIYVAPSWPRQDITVTNAGQFQPTLLAPEITVPALGNPPTGFAWLIDVVGSMRFINRSTTSPATILVQIQYNRAAVGGGVDGGNSAAANSQTIAVLTSYGMTPPTLTSSFTVNFYGYYDTATNYSLFASPYPTVRAYLVKV